MTQFEFKPRILNPSARGRRHEKPIATSHDSPGKDWTTIEIETPHRAEGRPLVVDLDGTLIASDLFIEAAFSELGRRPHALVAMTRALMKGKAALTHFLAAPIDFDPATLPYDPEVLALIRKARADGRPI